MNDDAELLRQLSVFGADLPFEKLIAYLKLLNKWNQAYNLTAIRDMGQMVTHHIFDSLAILPWLNGSRILDVGTGAGLPGIPIALSMPEKQVVLLDSNGKKIRFLREVKRALHLSNIEIVQSRVESYHPSSGFDTVISRAVGNLNLLVNGSRHFIKENGIWLAMKGRYPEDELNQLNAPYCVKTYSVPGIVGERCCVIINQ